MQEGSQESVRPISGISPAFSHVSPLLIPAFSRPLSIECPVQLLVDPSSANRTASAEYPNTATATTLDVRQCGGHPAQLRVAPEKEVIECTCLHPLLLLVHAMKVVALLSGGKDSLYALLLCLRAGHDVIAVATLHPPTPSVDEIDSHCFQTIGHQLTPAIAHCLSLPFYSLPLTHSSLSTALHYHPHPSGDEVEDLHSLLTLVQQSHPTLNAVCSGAILSTYQRLRIEHVATSLALTSLTPLWQRQQRQLLREMVEEGMQAVLVKVASMGLDASFVGRTIGEVEGRLREVGDRWGVNECGEGGEYETIVLDCPLFRAQKIVIEDSEVVTEGGDIAPVSILRVNRWRLQAKSGELPPLVVAPAPPPRVRRWKAVDAPLCPLPPSWCGSSSLSPLFPPIRVVGDLAFVSAFIASTSQDASASSPSMQLSAALSSQLSLLQSAGYAPSDVLSLLLAVPSMSAFASINATYAEYLPAVSPPSRTTIQLPCTAVQADLVACSSPHARTSLHVQSVSPWAPACIGPYSQSVSCYRLLFQAGQIGLVPWSMTVDSGGEGAEVQRVKDNCEAVLKAVRGEWSHCLLTIVWVATDDADVRREVIARYHSTASVLWLYVPALPRDAAVEVQQLAYQPAPSFTATHSTSSRKQGSYDLHCQSSRVDETALSTLVTLLIPPSISPAEDLDSVLDGMLQMVRAELQVAVMRAEQVWLVRCYVLQGLDVGAVERALYSAWKELSGSEADLPAVSFLPVLGLAVNDGQQRGVLSLHCLFCDTSMMPT